MAFVCYLDDSDDVQSSVITLAGYVAKIDAWEEYEAHSRNVYDRYKIGDILHAKEFHGTKGPFKNWSRPKKYQFIDDLFRGHRLTWGVAMSVGKSGFAANKKHRAIGPNMSPLCLALASIMHVVIRGNPLAGLIQLEGVSFVVESGHKNNGNLESYFHKVKNHELYRGVARQISFGDKLSARGLHLADMLAFHSRRFHSLQLAHPKMIIPKSPVLNKLQNKLPHILKVSTVENFHKLENPTDGDSVWASMPTSLGSRASS